MQQFWTWTIRLLYTSVLVVLHTPHRYLTVACIKFANQQVLRILLKVELARVELSPPNLKQQCWR